MLWPKHNSYKELDNEKQVLRVENSPPPITFLMVRPLQIFIWNYSLQLGLREWVEKSVQRIVMDTPPGEKIEGIL